jgi:hypothetical protein
MGMLQRRDGLCFGLETADERRIVGTMLVDNPDRDLPADVRLACSVEDAERVLADAFEQPVPPQRLSAGIQVRALSEDPLVNLAQVRRRIDPELVGQGPAGPLIGRQRVPLATRAIEGEHQLLPEALAEGVACGEALELADHLPELPELELRIDPLFDGREP